MRFPRAGEHTCGITVSGAVACWGLSQSGEIGFSVPTPDPSAELRASSGPRRATLTHGSNMTARPWRSLLAALVLGAPVASLVAQSPVTVAGYVTAAGGTPIQGAHVKARPIDVDVVTDAQGR